MIARTPPHPLLVARRVFNANNRANTESRTSSGPGSLPLEQAASTLTARATHACTGCVDIRDAVPPGVAAPGRLPCDRVPEQERAVSTSVLPSPQARVGHVDIRAARSPSVRGPCRLPCGPVPKRTWSVSTPVRPDPQA
jgi:hypothetical protein